jgi:hypothetical protein
VLWERATSAAILLWTQHHYSRHLAKGLSPLDTPVDRHHHGKPRRVEGVSGLFFAEPKAREDTNLEKNRKDELAKGPGCVRPLCSILATRRSLSRTGFPFVCLDTSPHFQQSLSHQPFIHFQVPVVPLDDGDGVTH